MADEEKNPLEETSEASENEPSVMETEEDATLMSNEKSGVPSTEASPFENLDEEAGAMESNLNSLELLFDLELSVSVELARKNILVSEILQLGEGSILEFDKMAGEPVDLLVNNKKIAEGEVVVIDDRFGIRVTNLLDPSERIRGI